MYFSHFLKAIVNDLWINQCRFSISSFTLKNENIFNIWALIQRKKKNNKCVLWIICTQYVFNLIFIFFANTYTLWIFFSILRKSNSLEWFSEWKNLHFETFCSFLVSCSLYSRIVYFYVCIDYFSFDGVIQDNFN